MKTYRFKAGSYADVSNLFIKIPTDEMIDWRVAEVGEDTEVEIVATLREMPIDELKSLMKVAESENKNNLLRRNINLMADTVKVSKNHQETQV